MMMANCWRKHCHILLFLMIKLVTSDTPISCMIKPNEGGHRRFLYQDSSEVECICQNERKTYIGNLNFAKQALSNIYPGPAKNIDLIIRDCNTLRLELNFHNVADKQPFNLKIYESENVEVNAVELALGSSERQTIVVKDVSHFKIEGRVQCRLCQENTGMINIQMENVSKFSMINSSVSLPLKLTGRHMEEVSIKDSTFTTLQWPGVFLHNSRHVEIVRNYFLHTMPRSISISLGETIIISHNLLEVGEALIVEQYEHQVIKCNRPSPAVLLPATCNLPGLELSVKSEDMSDDLPELLLAPAPANINEAGMDRSSASVQESDAISREWDIVVTVLGTVDTLGLVWIIVALVIAFILIASACCVVCNKRKRKTKVSKKTAAELRPDLLTIPFSSDDDGDEYSESSRAHLAKGDQDWRLPQYVTVQGVSCVPGEDGVVCGSLTLGPSFSNKDVESSERTVSSNILKQQAFSKV